MMKKSMYLFLGLLTACAMHTSLAMEEMIVIPNPAFTHEPVSIASLAANNELPQPQNDGFWDLADYKLETLEGLERARHPEAILGLKISHNMLRALPEKLFPHLTHLDISHNPLQELPPRMLDGLMLLKKFFACAIRIHEVPLHFFDNNPRLKIIDLSNNQLTALHPELLHQVSSLEKLILTNNKFTSLHPLALKSLSNLTLLDLSKNRFCTIPSQLCHALTKLEELNLESNGIDYFEQGSFTALGTMKEINCSRNKLTRLDPELFRTCSRLVELNAGHNQITTLDAALIQPLTALRALNLRGNPGKLRKELPQEAARILKERSLALGDPLFVQDMHTARTVQDLVAELIEQDRMQEIYYPHAKREGFFVIDLSSRNLTSIDGLDSLFTDRKHIAAIYAQNNHLTAIPCETLNAFPNLQNLDLRNNLIQSLEALKLPRLLYLLLSDNKLKTISRTALSGLRRLATLHLDHNQIELIEDGAFNRLERLTDCHLHGNRLIGIPQQLFTPKNCSLERLEELDLSDNQLGSSSQYSFPPNLFLQFFPQSAQPLQILAAQKTITSLAAQTPQEMFKTILRLSQEQKRMLLPIASHNLNRYLMLCDQINKCCEALEENPEEENHEQISKIWFASFSMLMAEKWDHGLTLFFKQLSHYPLHLKFLKNLCDHKMAIFREESLAQLAEDIVKTPKPLYDLIIDIAPPDMQCRLAAAQDIYNGYLCMLEIWQNKTKAIFLAQRGAQLQNSDPQEEIDQIQKKYSDIFELFIAKYNSWTVEMQCAFFNLINRAIKIELNKKGVTAPLVQ